MTDFITNSVAAPPSEDSDKSSVPTAQTEGIPELTAAIATVTSNEALYSESRLPPSFPTPHKRWIPEAAPDAPHDPHSYFPMSLVR